MQRQLADCRALADRLGWVVGEEYVDNDLSAYSGKRRPAYERMLDDLRSGVRDAVVVYHVDRLTRRPIELEFFLQAVEAGRVRHVRFVAGADVNIADGDGLMVLRLMSAVAANESASKSRRVKRKMEEVASAGRPHGGVRPFGYEADRVTVRPAEADIVRTIVARFLAGESLRSLAVWLNENEVATVTGKSWDTSTLRGMLRAPRLAGLREHRGVVVGPAVWPAILTLEEHQRILTLMEQRRISGERARRSYLLSGVLRCGTCGNRMFASRREHSRRYVCMSGPDHGGCGKMTITAEPVEELIADAVLYRLDTPELAGALAGRAAADEHTASVSDQIAQDRAQLDELAHMYARREITSREWVTARAPIEQRIRDNERALGRLTDTTALRSLIGTGAELRAHWSTLNLNRQVAIVKTLISQVTIKAATVKGGKFDPTRVEPEWRV